MDLLRSLVDPKTTASVRALRLGLLLLLAAACVWRVWIVFRYNPVDHIWSDPGRHWNHGIHPLDIAPMAAIDPVLYQVYVGALAKLTLKQPLLVAYWTALLSLAGPWLWYRFLRELLPSRDWALAGWVILAALPSWTVIYSYFMQETLMLPLLGLALWATWRCRRKGGTGPFLVAVACWMAAGLTRGICIPLGAVAMTWLWFSQGHKLPRAAASLVVLLAVLGPLAGRSWYLARVISPHGMSQLVQLYHLAGTRSIEIEFTRRAGAERWQYNFRSPGADEKPLAPLSDWQSRREWTAKFVVDLDQGRKGWDAAWAQLPPLDAQRLAWLTGDNLIRLFFGSSWPDSPLDRTVGLINHWARWMWVPLTVAALVLTVLCWRRQRERLLPALIVTWFAVQGLFPLVPNEGRYRKPFEGLLVAQCLLLAASLARSRRDESETAADWALEATSARG